MSDLLNYQREVATIGSKVPILLNLISSRNNTLAEKSDFHLVLLALSLFFLQVDGITLLEKFITNLQKERAEVAFHIFTNGSKTLEMNLTTRWQI